MIGPVGPPPAYDQARATFERALASAEAGDGTATSALLTEGHAMWANAAEKEVAELAGVELVHLGSRGNPPS